MGKRDGRNVHLAGPRRVSDATFESIEAELEAQRSPHWKRIRVEGDQRGNVGWALYASIELDTPNEQTVQDTLQALERAASSRVPSEIGVWRKETSWFVSVFIVEDGNMRVLATSDDRSRTT